ncbi:probable tetraacyldisaccharide 4'-kinase, mitochondrial [Tripterygium wilfordii]|uniref:probable tetraacyldisaccharide 4'-kinase, mitochondrial n=1 Tax=Tripterygium wilfordii TaxID=458696 RepID=UPI0018F8046A|nr:probable tetraacyldisaccharide 4'-kinase, mitochondrial [Tripterygium wilfordii]
MCELEIIMLNGLMPWGNHQVLPFGPVREPLTSLRRANVAVVHHSALVSEQKEISMQIYLSDVHNVVALCISAIASANSFVKGMEKVGAFFVDRLDFSDHHFLQAQVLSCYSFYLDLH